MTSTGDRPNGINVLAFLAVVGGGLGILGGVGAVGLGAVAGTTVSGPDGVALAGIAMLVGVLMLVLGVVSLAFAYGAWTLRPWAWILGMVVTLASIALPLVVSLLSSDIVASLASNALTIALWAVVLVYLNMPGVKAAFGRG